MFGFSPVMMARSKPKPPALGQFWTDQGGYYIGDIMDGGRLFYLVIAPKATGQVGGILWKTSITATSGTSSLTNGPANLAAMVAAGISSHPVGQWCKALTIGGLTDWYPPAKDELNVTFVNREAIIGADAITVDAVFCWSSSAHPNAGYAWAQRFNTGAQNDNRNDNEGRVRAIRRVAA